MPPTHRQNQVIKILSDQIRQKIIARVKQVGWYTVATDEVADVSNKEQLSIVVRFVGCESLIVREDLVGFTECDSGISGCALADKIMMYLQTYGFDLCNLHGQVYDGAGNMAGLVNGVASLITVEYPLTLYLHCASHCLNLAVESYCK